MGKEQPQNSDLAAHSRALTDVGPLGLAAADASREDIANLGIRTSLQIIFGLKIQAPDTMLIDTPKTS